MTELTCIGCGATFAVELPDGENVGARWARAIAKRASRCDSCAAALEREQLEALERQDRAERISTASMPRKWRGRGLEQLQVLDGQAKAIEAAGAWARTRDAGGLMLVGDNGVGKTCIAAAACWSRLERWPCRFASVAQAMASLGEDFSGDLRRRAVSVFAGAGAIVLDDVNQVRASDYGREQLYAAIDSRYQAEAPMLVTTNLTPSELGDRYGKAIASRLVEYCQILQVAGGDRRLQSVPELRAA